MKREFPIVKFLIILDCIALVSLLLTEGYRFTIEFNYPSFVLLFIIPIVIVALVLFVWGFSIFWKRTSNKKVKLENSLLEFISVLIIQAAYCFGLIAAWYNFFLITNTILAVYIIVVIITLALFVIYLSMWGEARYKRTSQQFEGVIRKTTWRESKKKLETEYDFESKVLIPGLTSDNLINQDNLSITYEIPSKHRYSDVFSKLKIEYINYLKALRLTMELNSDSLLSLNIQRRDSAFANLKDELVIPRLANVYVLSSPTPDVWVNLFNDTLFKQSLLLLRPHLDQFSLKGQYIEVVIYSEKAILKVLDWVMDLNPSMEKLTGTLEVTRAEKMLCYNCQDPFDPFEEVCDKCGSPRPRCIICFQDLKPEIDIDVIILPCCKIYAHKEHMILWLTRKTNCPNCHSDLSRWVNEIKI